MGRAEQQTVQARVGSRIRALRKAQRLTQQVLADRTGMDWRNIGRLERGERNPTVAVLQRIADGLHVYLWQLFLFSEQGIAVAPTLRKHWIAAQLRQADAGTRQLVDGVVALILQNQARG